MPPHPPVVVRVRRCTDCGKALPAEATSDRCSECRDRQVRTAALQQRLAERQAERDELREEYR